MATRSPTVPPFPWQHHPKARRIDEVIAAALDAVAPDLAVERHLRREGDQLIVGQRQYDLAAVNRVLVVGAGKASVPMAAAASRILGDRLSGGGVITKRGQADRSLSGLAVFEADHPVPDRAGLEATDHLISQVANLKAEDLVIALISGGASALMIRPVPGIGLTDLQATNALLLASGATIVELNTVRVRLSRLKGGGLARMVTPAQLIGLLLSDVVGDDPEMIGSGPTVASSTSFEDAWQVLERYGLEGRVPAPVRSLLLDGCRHPEKYAPQRLPDGHDGIQNKIIATNRHAVEAAAAQARRAGFETLIVSTTVQGEAREVGQVAAAMAREVALFDRPVAKPACLIWGGETTVTVSGRGSGGRNQELALSAAIALDGMRGVTLVALATDGTDGPTDAAGAVIDGTTARRARELGLDPRQYLKDNDAYGFFSQLGDLITTGPTQTNVGDVLFMFCG